MKKKKTFFKALAFLFVVCGGVSLFSNLIKASSHDNYAVVNAESDTYDMSKKAIWTEENAGIVPVKNWHNSGRGFSFEYQFTSSSRANMIIQLYSDDNFLQTTGDIYLMRSDVTKENCTPSLISSDFGKMFTVDAENGWYRFELLFSSISNYDSTYENATFNSIRFKWANVNKDPASDNFWNNLIIRNFKTIYAHSGTYNDTTGKSSLSYFTEPAGSEFPRITSFVGSGKGLFIIYKPIVPANRIPIRLRVFNGTNYYSNTMFVNYRDGKGNLIPDKGKEFDLADGWHRYEIMEQDIVYNGANREDIIGHHLISMEFLWGNPSQYGFEATCGFGEISQYSYKVTFHINSSTTEEVWSGRTYEAIAPETIGRYVKEWRIGSAEGSVYDFSTALTSNIDLYAIYDTSAIDFANDILSDIHCVSSGASAPSVTEWNNLKAIYLDGVTVSAVAKNILSSLPAAAHDYDPLIDIDDEAILKAAVRKYDYIIAKYGAAIYDNYIGRNVSSLQNFIVQNQLIGGSDSQLNISVLVIITGLLFVAATTFYISRKKKFKQ